MSPPIYTGIITDLSFPRVSGDEPLATLENTSGTPFSPRERG